MKKFELHDLEYWKNRPMDSEKDWVDEWPNWLESYANSAGHPHRQLIVDAVRGIYPVENILEIGCNAGSNLIRINEMFPEAKLFGIDINKSCIKKAKELLPQAKFKAGDITSLPYSDSYFDVVIADAVLMYANPQDIEKIMQEIDRVCKKHIIIVERFNESVVGVRNGHVWARNYPTILTELHYAVEIKKIEPQHWPYSEGWVKHGYIFVGTK